MAKLTLDEGVESIVGRALARERLSRDDALYLLRQVRRESFEMELVCFAADRLTRERFLGMGEAFSQVGLNFARSQECGFCALGSVESGSEMSKDEAVAQAKFLANAGANAVGFMATADYPFERFLAYGRAAREVLPRDFPLAANVAGFGSSEAKALVEAGFTAVYHVIRLREGVDSPIPPERRRQILLAARAAGLDVSYCLEPIGPEHTPEEPVEGIWRGEEFTPTGMATMRRIPVPGTKLAQRGQITESEQMRLQAITTLSVAGWSSVMMMGAHEPSMLFLRSGANRMTAEAGVNPRDLARETSRSRGRTVADCTKMLHEAGFVLRKGPSPAFQGPLRKRSAWIA